MRLRYKSWWYKIGAVARYYILRIYYGRKFVCPEMSMIGRRCGIHIRNNGQIICSSRIIVNDDVMLYSEGELLIGKNLGINKYSRIVAHEKIKIGDHVTVGQMVSILDHDHHYEKKEGNLVLDQYDTASITIGNHVWIGDKATILKGVTVGDNVIIGAHALVNKDVPSNSIVAGNPAKVVKEL